MSIVDHSHTYDIRYSREQQNEEFSGKFFWFSGFTLPYQKNQSFEDTNGYHSNDEEIKPIEETENFASPYIDDDRIYDAPNIPLKIEDTKEENNYEDPTVISPSATALPDSLYEIPVDQNIPPPEYEYHHYDLPDVVRNSEKPRTFSKHNYETPDAQKYEYANLIDKPPDESVHTSKVRFSNTDEVEDISPSHDGRFFKLKEKDTSSSDENEYVIANQPKQDTNHVTHDEPSKHHRKHSGRRKQENYAGGMWFGFAGRQHTSASLENLLDIDNTDAKPIEIEFETSVDAEPLYTTFEDIPDTETSENIDNNSLTTAMEIDKTSEIDEKFLEIDKLVLDTFNDLEDSDSENKIIPNVDSEIKPVLTSNEYSSPPESEIKPMSMENQYSSPPERELENRQESPKQSWNINIELSDNSDFHIASPDKQLNSPRDVSLESMVNQSSEKPFENDEPKNMTSYHRQPTLNLLDDQQSKPDNEFKDEVPNLEVGKSYNIEIIPDAKHLDIDSENPSYHVAFVKQKESKDDVKKVDKSHETKDNDPSNTKNDPKPAVTDDKLYSSLPRPARRSDLRPFQKSYSLKETQTKPRPELRKGDSFDGRRRSSHMNRHQDEPIGFSSLRNMFEPLKAGEEKQLPRNKVDTKLITKPSAESPQLERSKPKISKDSSMDERDAPIRPVAPTNYQKPRKLKERAHDKPVDETITCSVVDDVHAENVLPDFERPKTPIDRPKTPTDRPKTPTDRPKTPTDRPKTPELNILPQRRVSVKSKKPSTTESNVITSIASPSPRNLRRSKDDSDKPRISVKSQQSPKLKHMVRSKSFGEKPRPNIKMTEEVITQSPNEMKIFYQVQNNGNSSVNDNPKNLKRKSKSTSAIQNSMDISSDEDAENLSFHRGTSFRRSIVIEDEITEKKRKQSQGEKHVSVFFTPINPKDIATGKTTYGQQFRNILTYLDKMIVHVELFADQFDAVKQLQSLFWDLKDNEEKVENETLTGVINHLVSHEWPKIILGCLRKLQRSYSHVFIQTSDPESIIYYSGHMPSLLRMNRTSAEFAMAVIFDGLLKTAINFTDVHESSRIACCEEGLISYLIEEILPLLHGIHWGKNTARESFLKSICDLIYNCSQNSANTSYLIKHGLVEVFNVMLGEIYDTVEAKKVFMTIILAMSYLIDNNTNDVIIPTEGYIIRVLQFLDKSLEHSEHTYLDFFSAELTGCLSRLAAHDANKLIIARNSGQEILHKVIKHAYDDEEKIEACNALWNLAFNHEAKDTLRHMNKLLNALRHLKGSSNMILKRAASGVLWECEEKYDLKGSRETNVAMPNHIMISYELESQPIVINIRDELQHRGFSVWMNSDVDERGLQEIMTRGVESASIFIVALSRRYKQSPHCFSEVDYANKLHKDIIPIIIDQEYAVDGWLSNILEVRKTFDFSKPSMHHGSTDALIDYVQEIAGKMEKGDLSTNTENVDHGKEVVLWTNDDVITWLRNNNLIKSVKKNDRLEKLTGLHLIMFYDLKKESPDYYYSVLDSHLGFKDVLNTMEFSYALDQLLGNERLI